MIRLLLSALIVLFLTACAGRTVKDVSPASDLDALERIAERNLRPTLLPNGKEYCLEESRIQAQQDECAGNLEDALWSSNRDKERALRDIRRAIQRIRISRSPCNILSRLFNRDRCSVTSIESPR